MAVSLYADLGIKIDNDKSSLSLRGHAQGNNISGVVTILNELSEEPNNCVALDLENLLSIDLQAINEIAGSANDYKTKKKCLHLKNATKDVKRILDKLMLTDILCCEGCDGKIDPHQCATASNKWAVDVFSLPSEMNYCYTARKRIDKIAESLGFPKCYRNDLMIAVGEAVTNAIKYGRSDEDNCTFTISCLASSETFCITISDSGPGFNLKYFDECNDFESECGRGIYCIKALMDDVDYTFDYGTTVRMVKSL